MCDETGIHSRPEYWEIYQLLGMRPFLSLVCGRSGRFNDPLMLLPNSHSHLPDRVLLLVVLVVLAAFSKRRRLSALVRRISRTDAAGAAHVPRRRLQRGCGPELFPVLRTGAPGIYMYLSTCIYLYVSIYVYLSTCIYLPW